MMDNEGSPLLRGSVIVPAHNESKVIQRTIGRLSRAAVEGHIEVIVVCNGCTDDTAALAAAIPGVRVLDLPIGCKPAALNAGDAAANAWPRIYLDADIEVTPRTVLAVLDCLSSGSVLAARPPAVYDDSDSSPAVKRYYSERQRLSLHNTAMWGAGIYGLSQEGHRRLGRFPDLAGDDFYVDRIFAAQEKTVVPTDPVVVRVPKNVGSLLAILQRSFEGNREILRSEQGVLPLVVDSGLKTALAVIASIRSPRSAWDALTFLAISVAARLRRTGQPGWARDESSRA